MAVSPVDDLMAQIKSETHLMARRQGDAVLHAINLGRLYAALKKAVKKGRWARTLKSLSVDPRVADRYITIGESWWGTAQTQGSEPLPVSLLPCDVQKLSWLCRLNREQLSFFLSIVDCNNGSRGTVIKSVQQTLGLKPAASEEQPVSVKALKQKWRSYVERMVEAIDNLTEDINDETRRQLFDEMSADFTEVEDAIVPAQPEPDDVVEPDLPGAEVQDGTDADTEPQTTQQEEANVAPPVTPPPPTAAPAVPPRRSR
jgi:hypothetical protein